MTLNSSIFSYGALIFGLILVAATISYCGFLGPAIIAGVIFGVGGFLTDYLTDFRYLGGHLSSIAMAVGGIALAFYSARQLAPDGGSAVGIWPPALQYIGVVSICWSLQLLILRGRHH